MTETGHAECARYQKAVDAVRGAAAIAKEELARSPHGVVLLMDLDGMGDITARHGLPLGDRLLRQIEANLRVRLGGCAAVTRMAGDEFLVIVPGVVGDVGSRMLVDSVLQTIEHSTIRTRWLRRPVRVTATAGRAAWHDEATRASVLARAADRLIVAKRPSKSPLPRS